MKQTRLHFQGELGSVRAGISPPFPLDFMAIFMFQILGTLTTSGVLLLFLLIFAFDS